MKTSYVSFSIAIYALAILSLIATVSIKSMPLCIPLVIIMNFLAYQMVLRKNKKNPDEKVENNTNDMVMLYLCKVGGCLYIAFCLSITFSLFRMKSGTTETGSGLLGIMFVFFVIIFNVTPSVKKGVRTIQERYIYRQTNNSKEL